MSSEDMSTSAQVTDERRGFSGAQVALIVLVAVLVAAAATYFVARSWLFPSNFEPVELSAQEQTVLDNKLRRLEGLAPRSSESDQEWLRAEPYSEAGANRRIAFSEREINGLIARDPALANRLSIDLSDNLASARALIPLDPDLPLMGGRILRVNAGLELGYAQGRPRVILKGVSVMGVPVPNAWLGNLKNVDLIAEFGGTGGVWKAFADGVEALELADGSLVLQLRE